MKITLFLQSFVDLRFSLHHWLTFWMTLLDQYTFIQRNHQYSTRIGRQQMEMLVAVDLT